jgi:hypothetical protein
MWARLANDRARSAAIGISLIAASLLVYALR